MTLTNADVARLEAAGFRGFLRAGSRGQLHLRRVGDLCVFLRDGRCLAYHCRPEGCVLYPLVLDVGRDLVVLDDFCPHRDEFCFGDEERACLRRSVADEEREAAARVSDQQAV